jgi:hypothetical protein
MTSHDASARARVLAEAERRLSAEEADAYSRTPVSPEERAAVLAEARWFRRRYPTGADRLAYARRAYGRWTRRGVLDREE